MPTPSSKNPFTQGAYNPSSVTIVDWEYYDTLTLAHATLSWTLFQDRVGQSSKTLAETNMTSGGMLPTAQWFQVHAIKVFARFCGAANNTPAYSLTSAEAADIDGMLTTTTAVFKIANLSSQFEATLAMLLGVPVLGTLVPAATIYTQTGLTNSRWHGIYPLNNPITLPEQTGFGLEIVHQNAAATWITNHTITAATTIKFSLCGKLARMGA